MAGVSVYSCEIASIVFRPLPVMHATVVSSGIDVSLLEQLLGDAGGYAAGRFRENSFGFGKELDAFYDFRIGNVFGPAAAVANGSRGVETVGRIADGQRARDGAGFCGSNCSSLRFTASRNWRAAGGLRAEEFYFLFFDQAQRDQFVERFADFGDQRAAGHRANDVVRQPPAELLGDFVTHGLGAFRVVRPQVHVHKSPGNFSAICEHSRFT